MEYDYITFDTLKEEHKDPKLDVVLENKSLDFSFWDIPDIQSLKNKEPRAGWRKPIHDSDNEEENKDIAKIQKQFVNEDAKVDPNKDQKKEKEVVIIKEAHAPPVSSLIQANNVPLYNTTDRNARMGNMDLVQLGAGGKTGDEGKAEGARKKRIKRVCRTLLINNNEIRTITGMLETLELVMNAPHRLKFLDLSFNYLEGIDAEILNFGELTTLYLHGNYVYKLEDVRKLGELPNLLSLTLNGNPIEQIDGYRLYVLGMLYAHFETLKKFDSVVVTRKEKESIIVWNEFLYNSNKRGLPKLDVSKIRKMPPKKEEESKNGDKKASS